MQVSPRIDPERNRKKPACKGGFLLATRGISCMLIPMNTCPCLESVSSWRSPRQRRVTEGDVNRFYVHE